LNQLSSTYKDLKGILPRILGKNLPPILEFLGTFSATGLLTISEPIISLNCEVDTALGQISTDLSLDIINDINTAIYNGQLELFDFDLGALIQDTNFGLVNTNLNIQGQGFSMESIRSNIAGIFSDLEYNSYNYKDVEVKGLIENRIFSGELKTDDDNLKLDFAGLVDFSGLENIYDFSARVEQANLNALNFISRDAVSVFTGQVDMDMRGTNLDDLYGNIQFTETRYKNQNDSYYFDDFQITSNFDLNQIRTITFDSPEIIQGTFRGVFKIKQIPLMLENALGNLYVQSSSSIISPGQSLKFNFKVYNKIIEVFYPELEFGANTFF
jgi:hypothetical protein